jgi:hypothetical protein
MRLHWFKRSPLTWLNPRPFATRYSVGPVRGGDVEPGGVAHVGDFIRCCQCKLRRFVLVNEVQWGQVIRAVDVRPVNDWEPQPVTGDVIICRTCGIGQFEIERADENAD